LVSVANAWHGQLRQWWCVGRKLLHIALVQSHQPGVLIVGVASLVVEVPCTRFWTGNTPGRVNAASWMLPLVWGC
jgi:hypothetical protein